MQINFIESPTKDNRFYTDENLKKLVDLTLENFDNRLFEDILALISTDNLVVVDDLINQFKSENDNQFKDIYSELYGILKKIYKTKNKDNLRGSFLELIIFKILDKKYGIIKNRFDYGINGFIEINGKKSKKTIDVFSLCKLEGFVCECKIKSSGFENHDIENLNWIYICSNEILIPYIISLSSESFLNEKLSELYIDDFSNAFVNGQYIKIVSIDNFGDVFRGLS